MCQEGGTLPLTPNKQTNKRVLTFSVNWWTWSERLRWFRKPYAGTQATSLSLRRTHGFSRVPAACETYGITGLSTKLPKPTRKFFVKPFRVVVIASPVMCGVGTGEQLYDLNDTGAGHSFVIYWKEGAKWVKLVLTYTSRGKWDQMDELRFEVIFPVTVGTLEPVSGVEIHMEMDMDWKWKEMGRNSWKR